MDEITKLKAEAYDILAQIQFLERKAAEINQKIADLSQKKESNTVTTNNQSGGITAGEVVVSPTPTDPS